MGFINAQLRVNGLTNVQAKLAAAGPRMVALNHEMVTEMLTQVKDAITPGTPLGPGHFGFHLRDRYRVDVRSSALKTTGVLKSPPQGYWREKGTRRGERALMVAHHALAAVKKFIKAYYGGAATWYR